MKGEKGTEVDKSRDECGLLKLVAVVAIAAMVGVVVAPIGAKGRGEAERASLTAGNLVRNPGFEQLSSDEKKPACWGPPSGNGVGFA